MNLQIIPGEFAVCKIPDASSVCMTDDFFFLSRTDEELSLVCRTRSIPANRTAAETGWSMMRVMGPLDFSLTGILAGITGILAGAEIPVFAVSTFDTDYILVRTHNLARAVRALEAARHSFT